MVTERRLRWCECGSDWWTPKAVQMFEDGGVGDVAGPLVCYNCGADQDLTEPQDTPRPPLRLVADDERNDHG